ncbi:MAG: Kelch repeat-containing protein [Thalassotalea sp.]
MKALTIKLLPQDYSEAHVHKQTKYALYSLFFSLLTLFSLPTIANTNLWQWQNVEASGQPIARHEAGLVGYQDKIYLLGGRRINATSVFATKTQSWENLSAPPIELHHFQPVVLQDKIYIIGALTGQWPNEQAVDRVIIFDPKEDTYTFGDEIPQHRRRGGAGVSVYNNKIYLVGGIVNGHMDGYQAWFDEYDPSTGKWTTLPDAPNARDHFQALTLEDKLYAFSGRTTSKRTNQDMALTVAHGNIYDFKRQQWQVVTEKTKVPTLRAGGGAFVWQNKIVIGGGESTAQQAAHAEIEAFDTKTASWQQWPNMLQGRHGTGFVVIDGYVYSASGCGARGGEPELYSIERLKLPTDKQQGETLPVISSAATIIEKQWHTITRSFIGPIVSETDKHNPFLHYKLMVNFKHPASGLSVAVPGFFAADGNAHNSSADTGNIWQVRFNPPKQGQWQYQAKLYAGNNIAVSHSFDLATKVPLTDNAGSFYVIQSDKQGTDFKANGRLITEKGYFKFQDTDNYWLKGGTNSPENLLGYVDFDNTYRIDAPARAGEAAPNQTLHSFAAHKKDWQTGDPVWQQDKGKSIIGGINYLAEQGMNSVYFLTLNILGDGKDVWPYRSHKDFTRFDVSKLAQWEVLFEHMQSKGILLHLVIQETENETMLDNGDTGKLRKLYFNELIARFGHHLALVWNLGEENGYAKWSPKAQNNQQRKDMVSYLKANDPFNHPVLLHTHSHDPDRSDILNPLLSFSPLDGLSLQQDKREKVFDVIKAWRNKSSSHNSQWLITMDEIGKWDTGALPDSLDSQHLSLQRHVLWGSLLAGGSGVEWYFGAKYSHNDLTSEDWRQRHNLWQLTRYATKFFQQHIPFWQMQPCRDEITQQQDNYCAQKSDDLYVLYYFANQPLSISTPKSDKTYQIKWFNPAVGGDLVIGSKANIVSGQQYIGEPPDKSTDWVVVIKYDP